MHKQPNRTFSTPTKSFWENRRLLLKSHGNIKFRFEMDGYIVQVIFWLYWTRKFYFFVFFLCFCKWVQCLSWCIPQWTAVKFEINFYILKNGEMQYSLEIFAYLVDFQHFSDNFDYILKRIWGKTWKFQDTNTQITKK